MRQSTLLKTASAHIDRICTEAHLDKLSGKNFLPQRKYQVLENTSQMQNSLLIFFMFFLRYKSVKVQRTQTRTFPPISNEPDTSSTNN